MDTSKTISIWEYVPVYEEDIFLYAFWNITVLSQNGQVILSRSTAPLRALSRDSESVCWLVPRHIALR